MATRHTARGGGGVGGGGEPRGAEGMKVTLDGDGVVTRISKGLDPGASAGEFIGISRFDPGGATTLLDAARRLDLEGGTGLYYEDAIDACAGELVAPGLWVRGRGWAGSDDDVAHR